MPKGFGKNNILYRGTSNGHVYCHEVINLFSWHVKSLRFSYRRHQWSKQCKFSEMLLLVLILILIEHLHLWYMNGNPVLLPDLRSNCLNKRCHLHPLSIPKESITCVAHYPCNAWSQCSIGTAPCRQPVIRCVRILQVVRTTETSCDRLSALQDCH